MFKLLGSLFSQAGGATKRRNNRKGRSNKRTKKQRGGSCGCGDAKIIQSGGACGVRNPKETQNGGKGKRTKKTKKNLKK
jgi:hypothetical protein